MKVMSAYHEMVCDIDKDRIQLIIGMAGRMGRVTDWPNRFKNQEDGVNKVSLFWKSKILFL